MMLLHRNYNFLDLGIEKEHANCFHVSFQCSIKSTDHFLEAVIRLFQVLWSSLKAWKRFKSDVSNLWEYRDNSC